MPLLHSASEHCIHVFVNEGDLDKAFDHVSDVNFDADLAVDPKCLVAVNFTALHCQLCFGSRTRRTWKRSGSRCSLRLVKRRTLSSDSMSNMASAPFLPEDKFFKPLAVHHSSRSCLMRARMSSATQSVVFVQRQLLRFSYFVPTHRGEVKTAFCLDHVYFRSMSALTFEQDSF